MTVPFDIYDIFIIHFMQFLVNKKAGFAPALIQASRTDT